MQKVTQKHLLELLKAAGVQAVEVVSDDDYSQHVKDKPDNEADIDALLAEVDENRSKVLRPEIEKEIKVDENKKAMAIAFNAARSAVTRQFKPAGLALSDLEGVEKVEDMIKIALDKHNAKFSQDTEGLRTELTNQQQAWQVERENLLKEEETKRNELHSKYIEKDIDAGLMSLVASIPRDPNGNDSIRAKALKSHLREIAHLHYDEANGKMELRSKDDTNIPYMGGDGKKRVVDMKDVATEYATAMGWGVTDMRRVNPAAAMGQQIPNGNAKAKTDDTKDPVTAAAQEAASWGLEK